MLLKFLFIFTVKVRVEKHFIYIDDSPVAINLMQDQFARFFPNYQLHTFLKSNEALEFIKKNTIKLELIFCDFIMPEPNGRQVFEAIKQDPNTHSIPVVMISSEFEEKQKAELEKLGVFQFINKPFNAEILKEVIDRHFNQALDPKDLLELDIDFADDSIDQLEQAKALSDCKDETSVKELYRTYHTLKGGARSLQFPLLGTFIHLLEDLLTSIQKNNAYSLGFVQETISSANEYLIKQFQKIKSLEVLEKPNHQLIEKIELITLNINSGWEMNPEKAASNSTAPKEASKETHIHNTPSTQGNIRIANQKLDDLQARFKRIQQIRVKLNSFAQELKREFPDEGFPNHLIQLVSEMENEGMGIMDFFISLRVVSANRLKAFTQQTVKQASDFLNKKVELLFNAEEGIEIDQSIIEILETTITHLIRNSIDHGIEASETRKATGKPEIGKIKVDIIKDSREKFILKIQDDGAGINLNKLRDIVRQKGIMNEDTLRMISDEKVCDFIFLDGLSTKQDVSELSGRGVGLSAVKDRILKFGGSIETKTKMGEYTQFEIKMPRVFQL